MIYIGIFLVFALIVYILHKPKKETTEFEVGDILIFVGGNIRKNELFRVEEKSDTQVRIICIQGKDINGKDMVYDTWLNFYTAKSIFQAA